MPPSGFWSYDLPNMIYNRLFVLSIEHLGLNNALGPFSKAAHIFFPISYLHSSEEYSLIVCPPKIYTNGITNTAHDPYRGLGTKEVSGTIGLQEFEVRS